MTSQTSPAPQPSASPSNNGRQQQDDEIDLLALFGTLWESKILIAAITAVFMVLGVTYALVATPVYLANAIVQVEESHPAYLV